MMREFRAARPLLTRHAEPIRVMTSAEGLAAKFAIFLAAHSSAGAHASAQRAGELVGLGAGGVHSFVEAQAPEPLLDRMQRKKTRATADLFAIPVRKANAFDNIEGMLQRMCALHDVALMILNRYNRVTGRCV